MAIRIIVDSGSDISKEDAGKYGIEVLPLKNYFGEEEYLDGVTITHEEFYNKLIETDVLPTTSQISPYDYGNVFETVKENGDQAIVFTISAKLSGCYQSANIAASEYEEKIAIIDTANVSVAERILALYAANLRDEGKNFEEIVDIVSEKVKDVKIIAMLDTLEYLKKGGRISSATAAIGSVLSIKPVVSVHNGEVVMLGKARGSKSGNNMLKEYVKNEGGIDFDLPYALGYTGNDDSLLRKYIADSHELYDCAEDELSVSTIGSSIGTHVGPGAIALAFFKKH